MSDPRTQSNPKGRLSKQEDCSTFYVPELRVFIAFKDNRLYDKLAFISSYLLTPEAKKEYQETGKVGINPLERKKMNEQIEKARLGRGQVNTDSFYPTVPKDGRISNAQIREAKIIEQQLNANPELNLTDKQEKLLNRVKGYKAHKTNFDKKNVYNIN